MTQEYQTTNQNLNMYIKQFSSFFLKFKANYTRFITCSVVTSKCVKESSIEYTKTIFIQRLDIA